MLDDFNGFDSKLPYWGMAESPLVYEDKLFFTPGGKKTTIIALDKETGKTIKNKLEVKGSWWSWGNDKMGQGLEAGVKWVEENGEENELEKEVARVWSVLYSTPDRKQKQRDTNE